ncbi:aminotransferase class I/II-fold pyridoxal phosphate-dependent enzyme [Amycolatopsis silviterrae]|uniref:Aminotransferase class I/II-fold pyridoxal phosphate-dependent enzyme n=1 Tax=Amycolatopsis silviterrae TaxID=1656914 RepID=A0ABW5HMP9_9PSEU
MPLANSSYEALPLHDDPGSLNLAWTLDERELLDADLPALLAAELADESTNLSAVDRYLVQDPHGSAWLGPVVARLFGQPGWDCGVVCGAGVISLLHAVSALGHACVLGDVYPDLPHFVQQSGGTLASSLPGSPLILLDRPSAVDDSFDSLEAVRELCVAAAAHGGIVVIDESYANYRPPEYSAATIASQLDNLAVFRGLSKGYWLGGLRLSYCVCSPALTNRITALVPPMLASSLSLRLGAAVLGLGDITVRLRARIAEATTEAAALLAAAGFPAPIRTHSGLPHLHFSQDLAPRLRPLGIVGKPQPFWSGPLGAPVERFRLSVPLRPSRMAELERRLRAG